MYRKVIFCSTLCAGRMCLLKWKLGVSALIISLPFLSQNFDS